MTRTLRKLCFLFLIVLLPALAAAQEKPNVSASAGEQEKRPRPKIGIALEVRLIGLNLGFLHRNFPEQTLVIHLHGVKRGYSPREAGACAIDRDLELPRVQLQQHVALIDPLTLAHQDRGHSPRNVRRTAHRGCQLGSPTREMVYAAAHNNRSKIGQSAERATYAL